MEIGIKRVHFLSYNVAPIHTAKDIQLHTQLPPIFPGNDLCFLTFGPIVTKAFDLKNSLAKKKHIFRNI